MNLTHHFLIALPTMPDPYFKKRVIYLCEHNQEGAMGLMVNDPLDVTIHMMLKQTKTSSVAPLNDEKSLAQPVYNGGPVSEDRGFILHTPKGEYESSLTMAEDLALTTSKDILGVLGTTEAPAHSLVALGYANWAPGQLEKELADNSWLLTPATTDIIFSTPIQQRWEKAIALLGITPEQISPEMGNA